MLLVSSRSLLFCGRALTTTASIDDLTVRPFSELPGPRSLPYVGNALQMQANRRTLRDYFCDGFKIYGDIYKLDVFGM